MIEIEKKYRLSKPQREAILRRLPEIGARPRGEEFEENTLYDGESLDSARAVLRLRRAGKTATLTYKERFPTSSSIKHQREDETRVADPEGRPFQADCFAPGAAMKQNSGRKKRPIILDA